MSNHIHGNEAEKEPLLENTAKIKPSPKNAQINSLLQHNSSYDISHAVTNNLSISSACMHIHLAQNERQGSCITCNQINLEIFSPPSTTTLSYNSPIKKCMQ